MKTYQKLVAALAAISLLSVATLGCNTVGGAGKDIQKGGKTVENAAEGAKK